MNYDSTDDYTDLGDIPESESSSFLTWSFWVKFGALTVGNPIINKANLTLPSTVSQTSWGFSTDSSTSSTLDVVISTTTSDAGTLGYVSNALSTGTWIHVVAVFDGSQSGNSNRLKIYLNGKLQNTSYVGTIPSSTQATTSNVTIGSTSNHTLFGFNGMVDDFRIYTYPLSQAQVQKVYNEGAGVRFGPLSGTPAP
jgi:hypothetical protein